MDEFTGILKKNTPLKGIVIFYIDVGNCNLSNAKKLISETKDDIKDILDRIPEQYAVLWLPRRNQPSAIEIMRF
jgi:hypothetical protein